MVIRNGLVVLKALTFCTVFTAFLTTSSKASASYIFVRDTIATHLSKGQKDQMTKMVRNAVRLMPEQNLVEAEGLADFVLQPSILIRGNHLVLIIEKERNGEVLAHSEEAIRTIESSRELATELTDSLTDRLTDPSLDQKEPSAAQGGIADSEFADQGTSSSMSSEVGDEFGGDQPSDFREQGPLPLTDSGLTIGDVRAPSPRIRNATTFGTAEAGAGPAFGVGMGSDQPMIDLNLAYAVPITQMISAKTFGDFNFAAGSDTNHFFNIGLGAELFPPSLWAQALYLADTKPYLTAELGYALTKNNNSHENDAPALGGGGGFRFSTQELNLDIGLHYTILTAPLGGAVPSVLALRAAMNF